MPAVRSLQDRSSLRGSLQREPNSWRACEAWKQICACMRTTLPTQAMSSKPNSASSPCIGGGELGSLAVGLGGPGFGEVPFFRRQNTSLLEQRPTVSKGLRTWGGLEHRVLLFHEVTGGWGKISHSSRLLHISDSKSCQMESFPQRGSVHCQDSSPPSSPLLLPLPQFAEPP